MESNFVLKESRIISINFNVNEINELGDVSFGFTFELGINNENPKLAKISGKLEANNDDESSSFLELNFAGVFEGNNDNPDLKFEEMEESEVKLMLNSLINEISPMVKQIFDSSFKITVDLKSTLKVDWEKDPSES